MAVTSPRRSPNRLFFLVPASNYGFEEQLRINSIILEYHAGWFGESVASDNANGPLDGLGQVLRCRVCCVRQSNTLNSVPVAPTLARLLGFEYPSGA